MPRIRIFGADRMVGPAKKLGASGDAPRFVRSLLRRNPATAETIREDQQSVFFEVPEGGRFEILTPPAVARALGCSPGRVIQLIQEKKLKATPLGRTWLILRPDLEKYILTKSNEIQRRYAAFLGHEPHRTQAEEAAKRARRKEPRSAKKNRAKMRTQKPPR